MVNQRLEQLAHDKIDQKLQNVGRLAVQCCRGTRDFPQTPPVPAHWRYDPHRRLALSTTPSGDGRHTAGFSSRLNCRNTDATIESHLFELIVKANLQLRNISQAKFWLSQRKQVDQQNATTMYLESSILGLEAKYPEARVLLEQVNQTTPMKFHVLSQLVLVCEQMRDYSGAAAYLKAALRVAPMDKDMSQKKALYAKLGVM